MRSGWHWLMVVDSTKPAHVLHPPAPRPFTLACQIRGLRNLGFRQGYGQELDRDSPSQGSRRRDVMINQRLPVNLCLDSANNCQKISIMII